MTRHRQSPRALRPRDTICKRLSYKKVRSRNIPKELTTVSSLVGPIILVHASLWQFWRLRRCIHGCETTKLSLRLEIQDFEHIEIGQCDQALSQRFCFSGRFRMCQHMTAPTLVESACHVCYRDISDKRNASLLSDSAAPPTIFGIVKRWSIPVPRRLLKPGRPFRQ